MKYAAIVLDGMSERFIRDEGFGTPLREAYTPAADMLSAAGECGIIKTSDSVTVPAPFNTNAYILGYDPDPCPHGLAALRAFADGIKLKKDDVILECSLVSLSGEDVFEERTVVSAAPEISRDEADEVFGVLSRGISRDIFELIMKDSGELLLVWHSGEASPGMITPVHEGVVGEQLPDGDFTAPLVGLVKKSCELLRSSDINKLRAERGLPEISCLWINAIGTMPKLGSFRQKYGVSGTVLTADKSITGLAKCAKLRTLPYISGRLEELAASAIEALESTDFVYLNIHDAAEYSIQNDAKAKTAFIERVDRVVTKPLSDALRQRRERHRIMLLSSYSYPCGYAVPTSEPVPYFIYDSSVPSEKTESVFSEEYAFSAGKYIPFHSDIMSRLLMKADKAG